MAVYHTLLQVGLIPEAAAPCRQGVSCTNAQFELFGFFSIPMLSFIVFSIVSTLLMALKRSSSR